MQYKLKQSKHYKNLRLSIHAHKGLVVTAPLYLSVKEVDDFIKRKKDWIENKLKFFEGKTVLRGSKNEYIRLKSQALSLAQSKVQFWNRYYGYKYSRITIKNARSLWGSCSRKGSLNFNYKIVFLPPAQLDYLIVHELCHLKEMNHSSEFWNLVQLSIPNFKVLRKALKDIIA
jgi:predicted metal-dependent hydrolase